MLAASAISLIGMPPLIGFFGKLALFSSAIEAGQTTLVIVAAVNSAISAFYYLQLVAVPMFGQPNARTETVQAVASAWPRFAAVLCGIGVIVLPIGLAKLVNAAASSTEKLAKLEPTPGQIESIDASAFVSR
jgi:NADH-quinone oxidoreductase subunit N